MCTLTCAVQPINSSRAQLTVLGLRDGLSEDTHISEAELLRQSASWLATIANKVVFSEHAVNIKPLQKRSWAGEDNMITSRTETTKQTKSNGLSLEVASLQG